MTWIQTCSGKKFDYSNLSGNEINIYDIASALAKQCRFAGHSREFYSVAEHSVRVMEIVPDEHKLIALLHDAPEAFTLDIPRPLKRMMCRELPGFKKMLQDIESSVLAAFGLGPNIPDVVKKADNILLLTERRDLLDIPPEPWELDQCDDPDVKTLGYTIRPWTWQEARNRFLAEFEFYMLLSPRKPDDA